MASRVGFSREYAVRIVCALALLFVGFAHKLPVMAPAAAPSEMAEYLLPDGSIPTLCLPSTDGKAQSGHDLSSPCEACRLSASVILPVPADWVGAAVLRHVDRSLPVRHEAHYRQLFPPNATPRGPPSGLYA